MPEDNKIESEIKSEIAQHKLRDNEGHFVKRELPKNPEKPLDPIGKLFSENVHYSKSKDDLLDIHVGNPLHKVVQLLQDIKQQKAFSFTLKGSLGIAGVALALAVFGILGAGNLLCEKGIRKEIGTIKVLNVQEQEPASVPLLSGILDYFSPRAKHNSVVLVKRDETVISLSFRSFSEGGSSSLVSKFYNYPVIATGNYDTCSQTLKITDPNGVQIYTK